MTDTTKHGQNVKLAILTTGLLIWRELGMRAVSAREIGRRLKMTHGAILYHYPAKELHDALAVQAVKTGDAVIIPQLIGMGHSATAKLTTAERDSYIRSVRRSDDAA